MAEKAAAGEEGGGGGGGGEGGGGGGEWGLELGKKGGVTLVVFKTEAKAGGEKDPHDGIMTLRIMLP